jgi:hypothetical protein
VIGAADQNDIALMGEEVAAGEVTHQALVDWRAGEVELLDLLGQPVAFLIIAGGPSCTPIRGPV